jgi:hypothetical protein
MPGSGRLQKLRRLESNDRRLLLCALWLLPVRSVQLYARGFRRFVRRPRPLVSRRFSALAPDVALDRARRTEWLVDVAARYGVTRGSCLSRSLTLVDLLDRQGIPNELRIGVRYPPLLKAHAWVECQGVALNDREDAVARFTPMPDLGRPTDPERTWSEQ